MRSWLLRLSLAVAAGLAFAGPAAASTVYVSLRSGQGPVPEGTLVAAFSYDVRRVFPQVQARYEQWRPKSSAIIGSKIPLLPQWADYHLIHAVQLEEFRDAFRRAHIGEKDTLDYLMPKFDAVYNKYGASPGSDGTDALGMEDARQAWCKKITTELDEVITAYNAGVRDGGESFSVQNARWLAQRNEALRIAATQAGGNDEVNFQSDETNEGGTATFDLPPGTWYFACQSGDRCWYMAANISEHGGQVSLLPDQASRMPLDLASWMGAN